ncbi:MAG TPA: hypothetical protein VGJ01_08470 [Pseudolabrys sp.]
MSRFPSATVSPIDEFNRSAVYRFSLVFTAFVFLADITNFVGFSPYSAAIKYIYTAIAGALVYHYFSRFESVSTRSAGPPLALAFFVVAAVGFAANLLRGIEVSYISAFTASLVFASASFIPAGAFAVNVSTVCRDLRRLFLLGSVCYLFEASLKASGFAASISYAPEIQHVKSIVCVMGIAIAILTRSQRSIIIFLTITIASLIVRPSTSLLIATVICMPLAYALRSGLRRTYSAFAWAALMLAAITPWLFYWSFDSIANIVTDGEAYVKEGLLEGHSNTDFRLAIFRLALRSLDGSLLFGQALSGNPNVDLGAEFRWWHEIVPEGTALIHSDWLVVVTQAGAVGATLFFLMFASILKLRLRALAAVGTGAPSATSSLLSLSIVGCVAFFLYSSFNPVLPLYHIAHSFWFILLVSEIVARGVLSTATECANAAAPEPELEAQPV